MSYNSYFISYPTTTTTSSSTSITILFDGPPLRHTMSCHTTSYLPHHHHIHHQLHCLQLYSFILADAFLLTMITSSSSSSSSYSSPASLSTAVSLHTSRCFPSNYDHIIIISIIIFIIITSFVVYSYISSY